MSAPAWPPIEQIRESSTPARPSSAQASDTARFSSPILAHSWTRSLSDSQRPSSASTAFDDGAGLAPYLRRSLGPPNPPAAGRSGFYLPLADSTQSTSTAYLPDPRWLTNGMRSTAGEGGARLLASASALPPWSQADWTSSAEPTTISNATPAILTSQQHADEPSLRPLSADRCSHLPAASVTRLDASTSHSAVNQSEGLSILPAEESEIWDAGPAVDEIAVVPPQATFDSFLRRTLERKVFDSLPLRPSDSTAVSTQLGDMGRLPIQDVTNLVSTSYDQALHRQITTRLAESFGERQSRARTRADGLRQEYRERDERWRTHCATIERGAKLRRTAEAVKTIPEARQGAAFKRMATAASMTGPSAGTGRFGSRRNTIGDAVRSEAEFLAVLADLEDEELRDPTMRATRTEAMIPDMLDTRHPDPALASMDPDCTRIDKPLVFYRTEARLNSRDWTREEVHTYCRRFAQHPKSFGRIAAGLEGRTTAACVAFYYANKHRIDFKRLLDKKSRRRNRALKKGGSLMANLRATEQGDEVEEDGEGGLEDRPAAALLDFEDIPLRRSSAVSRQASGRRTARPLALTSLPTADIPSMSSTATPAAEDRMRAAHALDSPFDRIPALGYFDSVAPLASASHHVPEIAPTVRHGMSFSSLLHANDEDVAVATTKWFSDTEMTDEEAPPMLAQRA